MRKFLVHELRYPKDARKSRIEGRVFVQFVGGVDGRVEKESVLIIKGLTTSCDSEAVRVVKLFPAWTPAMDKGLPVRSRFVLPINFKH